jgi:hypothetical protein
MLPNFSAFAIGIAIAHSHNCNDSNHDDLILKKMADARILAQLQ